MYIETLAVIAQAFCVSKPLSLPCIQPPTLFIPIMKLLVPSTENPFLSRSRVIKRCSSKADRHQDLRVFPMRSQRQHRTITALSTGRLKQPGEVEAWIHRFKAKTPRILIDGTMTLWLNSKSASGAGNTPNRDYKEQRRHWKNPVNLCL